MGGQESFDTKDFTSGVNRFLDSLRPLYRHGKYDLLTEKVGIMRPFVEEAENRQHHLIKRITRWTELLNKDITVNDFCLNFLSDDCFELNELYRSLQKINDFRAALSQDDRYQEYLSAAGNACGAA